MTINSNNFILLIITFLIFLCIGCSNHSDRLKKLESISAHENVSYSEFIELARDAFKKSQSSDCYDVYWIMSEKMDRDKDFLFFCEGLTGDNFVDMSLLYFRNDYSKK